MFAFLEKLITGGVQFILRPFSHPDSTELVLVGNIKDSKSRDKRHHKCNERGIQMAVGKPSNIFWKIGENAEGLPTDKLKSEIEC